MALNHFHRCLLSLLAVLFCLCGPSAYGQEKPSAAQIADWQKAAEKGDANAQYKLGFCYEFGKGVAKVDAEAVKWYRMAAEQGDIEAQGRLGYCYLSGQGVAKDEAEAVRWWHKAAERGYAAAQSGLGWCYRNGQGVVKNEIEGYKWYRMAAEQGDVEAQYNLGDCYLSGQGVAKDEAEAVRWWRKAADQGLAAAQTNLGACYDNGRGVVKNEIEGYKWALLAAAQGGEIARQNASSHEKRLSPAQRAEGRRLAQEWETAHANLGEDDLGEDDLDKRKEIERLLELTGMGNIMEQMLDQMLASFQTKEITGIPEEFWTRFRKGVNTNDLINLIIPIYDKYYTMEDLKVVNAFYSSDAGKRMIATMPQAMNEAVQVGQEWGESLAEKVAAELEKEKAGGGLRKYNPATGTIE